MFDESQTFSLTMYVLSLLGFLFLVLRAYVLPSKGKRTSLKYVPAMWMFISGLMINISRHLNLVPQSLSKFAFVVGGVVMIIAVVLMEREQGRAKKKSG